MRWLYHVAVRPFSIPDAAYAPPSLSSEGFVHCSYQPSVLETISIYFQGKDVVVAQLDPKKVGSPVRDEATPRGAMPHVYGPIAKEAFVRLYHPEELGEAPDEMPVGQRGGAL